MCGQIRGLGQALRNAWDTISLIETADGAGLVDQEFVQRTWELDVKAANGTTTYSGRKTIQEEVKQLAENDNVTNGTKFNTIKLLNGGGKISQVRQMIWAAPCQIINLPCKLDQAQDKVLISYGTT